MHPVLPVHQVYDELNTMGFSLEETEPNRQDLSLTEQSVASKGKIGTEQELNMRQLDKSEPNEINLEVILTIDSNISDIKRKCVVKMNTNGDAGVTGDSV